MEAHISTLLSFYCYGSSQHINKIQAIHIVCYHPHLLTSDCLVRVKSCEAAQSQDMICEACTGYLRKGENMQAMQHDHTDLFFYQSSFLTETGEKSLLADDCHNCNGTDG